MIAYCVAVVVQALVVVFHVPKRVLPEVLSWWTVSVPLVVCAVRMYSRLPCSAMGSEPKSK